LFRLEPGATHEVGGRGIYFVLSGEGGVAGQPYGRLTTVFLEANERAALTASAETEILHYGLPDLSALADTAFSPASVAAE
jgi:hypothetical protein